MSKQAVNETRFLQIPKWDWGHGRGEIGSSGTTGMDTQMTILLQLSGHLWLPV